VRLIAAAVGCLIAIYTVCLAVIAARSGLTWREMDFDHDGVTSVGELFSAADVGTRSVQRDGRTCTEYFFLKDGLPITVRCPAGLRSSASPAQRRVERK
jgi:hypothetical protein